MNAGGLAGSGRVLFDRIDGINGIRTVGGPVAERAFGAELWSVGVWGVGDYVGDYVLRVQ